MRKADLYIRVSTDEQADKGYSQRDQEDRLRKYCELKSISIRNIYVEDHSAKSFNRPEWQKYLSNLRKLKIVRSGLCCFLQNGTGSVGMQVTLIK